MARNSTLRSVALSLSNVLLPIAVLVFASGFFPYKPYLPGLATFEDVQETDIAGADLPEAIFDRVVFMVVDALRSDFVYGHNSGFAFTQSLIRSGAAIPFTAHATPPTVTMPRVKALTTGSVPSFLDLILNFAESDTTSTLANQDTWLAQIRARGGKIVFYGDDTWLKLFPSEFFARADGTSSFFVSDFTEVDHNVTRHVPTELANDDWSAMIMHYLGLDHIGHKTGPQGPNMLPKQREMDGIVQQIYQAMETLPHHGKTLLVLAGDHGMNAGGNHGGSGPGETEPALLFASPIFKSMRKERGYECPTQPKEGTEFHYYTKIEQSDVVPALAGLMGLPISKNSLGVFIRELTGFWKPDQIVRILQRNARQLLHIVHAKYGKDAFDEQAKTNAALVGSAESPCRDPSGDEEELACKWAEALACLNTPADPAESATALYRFLFAAQDAMSSTASSYDIPRMAAGICIATFGLLLSLVALPSLWPMTFAGASFSMISLLYGVMMFASSYVEEEQHFWYWLTPGWILLLVTNRWSSGVGQHSKMQAAAAGAVILTIHRFALRWNQTGQKHAGEPDIVHTFFPDHHMVMWILILTTYVVNGWFLHNRSFVGLFMPEITAFVDVSLVFLGIVFKLNFTQADAPELVQGLASKIREWSEPFSLVLQARGVFGVLAAATVAVVLSSVFRSRVRSASSTNHDEPEVPLSERLHHLLTLFLMTQTRGPNVPLFLGLELQRLALHRLLTRRDNNSKGSKTCEVSVAEVALSTLLLSHVYFFCMGGTNSISSLDLSNAYNGVADYNIAAVGVLLFASNWQGPIWWCSAAVLLITNKPTMPPNAPLPASEEDKDWVIIEREKLREDALAAARASKDAAMASSPAAESWLLYIASMTSFIACGLIAVMAACTALRTHLFIWTVFSPKYLYSMAWSVGWHLVVNVVFGSLLYSLAKAM